MRERVDGGEDRAALHQVLVDRVGQLRVDVVRVHERDDRDVLRQALVGRVQRHHLEALAEFGEQGVGRAGGLFAALRQRVGDRQRADQRELRALEAGDGGDELGQVELQEAFARRIEHRHGADRVGLLGREAEVGVALRGAHRGESLALGALFFLRVRARVGHDEAHLAAGGGDVFAEQRLDAAGVALEVGAQLHVGAADEELERHRLVELGDDAPRARREREGAVGGEVGARAEGAEDQVDEEGGRQDGDGGEQGLGSVHGGGSVQRRSTMMVLRPRPAKATDRK